MAKSIIVYGVKGGKTRFAKRIADHFGLRLLKKEFSSKKDAGIWATDSIYFTRETEKPQGYYAEHSRSFQEVADEINAAIPLTDWQSGPPPMVGEWVTYVPHNLEDESSKDRRYWHGEHWSVWYGLSESDDEKTRSYNAVSNWTTSQVKWRGLSEEPILVKP